MFKAKILSNLKISGCKWVNYFHATSGLEKEKGVKEEFDELIEEGRIEHQTLYLGDDKFDRPIHGTLYRYVPRGFGSNDSEIRLVE